MNSKPFKPHIYQRDGYVGILEKEVENPFCIPCLLLGRRQLYTLLRVDYNEGYKKYKCPKCDDELFVQFCGTNTKG